MAYTPRVLIIDDAEPFVLALQRYFRLHAPELEVQTATRDDDDPVSCWERGIGLVRDGAAAGRPVDLVLTDLFMPDAEAGYTVLQRVKTDDPHVMTILYTGRPSDLDRKRAYELNVYAIVNRADPDIAHSIGAELLAVSRGALSFRDHERQIRAALPFADEAVVRARVRTAEEVRPDVRPLTVVFWDIRGFSALTEQLIEDPDIVAEFIAWYWNLARMVIGSHNGILDKFIGDGVMALFGHPLKPGLGSDGAPDAVQAALDLHDRFHDQITDWVKRFRGSTLKTVITPTLGCGINTGKVMVGFIGSERGQFTALGMNVNVADRVQNCAHDWPILVTQTTMARVTAVPGWQDWVAFEPVPLPRGHGLPTGTLLYSAAHPVGPPDAGGGPTADPPVI